MGVSRRKLRSNNLVIVKVFVIAVICLGSGVLINYTSTPLRVVNAINTTFTDDCVVPMERFMESEPERIEEYALKFEKVMETYNMASNLTGDGWDHYVHSNTLFTKNPASYGIQNATQFTDYCDPLDTEHFLNEISYYDLGGHSVVYSSYAAIGESLRYACAVREQNNTAIEESREHLLHLAKAYDLLSAVPPDGMMARMVIPDTEKAHSLAPSYIFKEEWHGSHLFFEQNYSYNGKKYTFYCETGTSVDCYMAYNALGMIYAMCNDTEIRSIVQKTVDRMLNFHVKRGWRFLDYDGKSHSMGAEAMTGSPIIDPMYALTFLRTGKTCNPEKWGDLYDSYVHERLFNKKVGKHAKWDIFSIFAWSGGFFNINLAMTLAGTLCFLEDDPKIKRVYQENYLEPMHEIVKYYRNLWFDTLYYLAKSDVFHENYQSAIRIPIQSNMGLGWRDYLEASIGDSLTRMSYTKYPYRRFRHPNGLDSYDAYSYLTKISGAPYPDPEIYYWEDYFNENDPLVKAATSLMVPARQWTEARPADWYHVSTWVWESSPFSSGIGGPDPRRLCMGGGYTSPYWIARYLNISTVSV